MLMLGRGGMPGARAANPCMYVYYCSTGGPNAWKHFGPELDRGMRALHTAPGRRGILEEGLRGGVPGRPPFWRTLVSPVRDWTPVP